MQVERDRLHVKIAALTTSSAMLRSAALLALADTAPILVTDIDEEGVSMRLVDGWDRLLDTRVPLAHACITCSLREGILPLLADLADDGLDRLILALPVGAEAMTCLPSLAALTEPDEALRHCSLTTNLHLVDADTAARDLFEHIPLADLGSALFDGDDRCTGEALMNGTGYADVVCALGSDPTGLDLIEHLRPLDTLLVHHLEQIDGPLLFDSRHDPDQAIARIHPAMTEAWGGPADHGVWTLDLHSERPLHPRRLRDEAASLAPEGVCARGCFWLPSRPTMIGTWEVAGGGASVGSAGYWDDGAYTHLIVTGTGGESQREAVRAAFERLLMTPEEMEQALDWVGVDDGLGVWFDE
ncbi:GTP-binding protein [Actinomyces sp. B33]|uniref:GTP-binding protein n=1 Tax=Actinomyces sp. B33 TaxID=2942131 RepID=UPI002340214A|nr:GTP-binding protein [Actinomyces sp. B33]MDC4232895.1 GTP-binding protein [Actinomyces sp. B33]